MEIKIETLQKKIHLNLKQIKTIIQTILTHQRVKQGQLSVVFVSRQKIQALNKRFLKRSYATDVLAFDFNEQPSKNTINGEIIISVDAALKSIKEYNTSFEYELILYVAHGILHLLGYDDHNPSDIKKMRKQENQLMGVVEKKLSRVLKNQA